MTSHRMTAAMVPKLRDHLNKQQAHKCPLCEGSIRANSTKKPALDHDHSTGFVRDVLCVNCNGVEGKIFNLVRRAKGKLSMVTFLRNLIAYYIRHETPQHGGILHYTHRSEEEKRLKRNKKARERRAAAKSKK